MIFKEKFRENRLQKSLIAIIFRYQAGHFAIQPLSNEVGVLKFATLICAPRTGKSIEMDGLCMSFDTF